MQKFLLTFIALLLFSTTAIAEMRFGIIGEQEHGAGLFIWDDMFNASITYATRTTDYVGTLESDDESVSKLTLGVNYKLPIDSMTSLTAGVSYATLSGYLFSSSLQATADMDSGSVMAINTGVERILNNHILITAQASLYTVTSIELAAGDISASSMLTDGRVGIAYLF